MMGFLRCSGKNEKKRRRLAKLSIHVEGILTRTYVRGKEEGVKKERKKKEGKKERKKKEKGRKEERKRDRKN